MACGTGAASDTYSISALDITTPSRQQNYRMLAASPDWASFGFSWRMRRLQQFCKRLETRLLIFHDFNSSPCSNNSESRGGPPTWSTLRTDRFLPESLMGQL